MTNTWFDIRKRRLEILKNPRNKVKNQIDYGQSNKKDSKIHETRCVYFLGFGFFWGGGGVTS